MKPLPVILAVVSVALLVAVVVIKRDESAQMDADAAALTDCSNRLDSAQSQITIRDGTILTLSNRLDAVQAAAAACSNQLAEAQSAAARDAEQLADFKQQIATAKSENQNLNQSLSDLKTQTTAQIASLTNQLAATTATLKQANKDYALLENRFRIDVAERTVVERKFNVISELQAQLEKLQKNPGQWATPESIYAGLDVEVKSNSFHVIAPN
jgi:chromosome segregation ATPase